MLTTFKRGVDEVVPPLARKDHALFWQEDLFRAMGLDVPFSRFCFLCIVMDRSTTKSIERLTPVLPIPCPPGAKTPSEEDSRDQISLIFLGDIIGLGRGRLEPHQ